jgi:hypothetical protein
LSFKKDQILEADKTWPGIKDKEYHQQVAWKIKDVFPFKVG